ncbi:acid protease [Daedaleopsis nitida]|nr:acid protease [Daedaleopsis nitida]
MARGFSSSFFSLLLALTLVDATPVVQMRDSRVSLSIAKKFNFTGSSTILARDQARAKFLQAKAKARLSGVPLSSDVVSTPADNQVVSYIAEVGVGNPAKTFNLIIDTGSSNTWVGATQPFTQTSTTRQTRDRLAVDYGSGFVRGTEFIDTVNLGPGLTIVGQSLGVATSSGGFDGVDGILGIGPVDLTVDTLSPDTTSTVPTVTDNLFAQGIIPEDLVAVSFEPSNSIEIVNGELTWGGTDSSKFVGALNFAPLTRTSPASEFWGIDQSIRLGPSTNIMSNTAGIVDTGTTLMLIPTDAFSRYERATGAKMDNTVGLLKITNNQFISLPSLFFTINGVTFEFTANAQIFPRALNTAIGGDPNSIYLIVGSVGTPSGEGLDFINGQVWLERFYTVFDTANNRIGFANTPFTTSNIN